MGMECGKGIPALDERGKLAECGETVGHEGPCVPKVTPKVAYVVVEQSERYGDYPVALLGVYLDEKAAQQAVDELREGHEWGEDDDETWCLCCFQCWEYETVELVTAAPFKCQGCGRPELDCSKDPCEDVIEDRKS